MRHIPRHLSICICLAILILFTAQASGESRATFSLRNVWAESGVYKAELWATVSSAGWDVGSSAIYVIADETALNAASYSGLEALDAYPPISGSTDYYTLDQLDIGGNSIAIVIRHMMGSSNYVHLSAGQYHLATIRWDIVNPGVSDQLAFDPLNTTVLHQTTPLERGVADATGYSVVAPSPRTIGRPVITQQPELEADYVCIGMRIESSVGIAGAPTPDVY